MHVSLHPHQTCAPCAGAIAEAAAGRKLKWGGWGGWGGGGSAAAASSAAAAGGGGWRGGGAAAATGVSLLL